MTTDAQPAVFPPMPAAAAAPAVFRSPAAPVRRTLIDILDETVRAHPTAGALDSGATWLTLTP